MSPERWPIRVDTEWQRAARLAELSTSVDPGTRAALRQSLVFQLEFAACCYAAECVPPGTAAVVDAQLLTQAQVSAGRRWTEFAAIIAPVVSACAELRRPPVKSRGGEPLKNPLFATSDDDGVFARLDAATSVTLDELCTVALTAPALIARQRSEAEEC